MNDQEPEKSLFNNVEIRWVEKGGSWSSLLNSSVKIIYWKWLEPKRSFQSPGITFNEKNWIISGDYNHLNAPSLCFMFLCVLLRLPHHSSACVLIDSLILSTCILQSAGKMDTLRDGSFITKYKLTEAILGWPYAEYWRFRDDWDMVLAM